MFEKIQKETSELTLEERYNIAVGALRKIGNQEVPSEGPEHNAYYDTCEYALKILKSIEEVEDGI